MLQWSLKVNFCMRQPSSKEEEWAGGSSVGMSCMVGNQHIKSLDLILAFQHRPQPASWLPWSLCGPLPLLSHTDDRAGGWSEKVIYRCMESARRNERQNMIPHAQGECQAVLVDSKSIFRCVLVKNDDLGMIIYTAKASEHNPSQSTNTFTRVLTRH